MNKIKPHHLIQKKQKGEKIVMLTAYDYVMAKLLDEQEIDIVFIGDSLGNVFSGYDNTLPVTMEHMLYHTQAVSRACAHSLVLSDMPFLSYQVSEEEAKRNAGLLLKEGGAHAVKMELSSNDLTALKAVIDMGVPVMGHIGFTPQLIHSIGGYKIQGKDQEGADQLKSLAKECEVLGCFALVLEMVPAELAKEITSLLSIPTIGVGAGVQCDGQVLVTHDLCGFDNQIKPKFVKQYSQLGEQLSQAVAAFKKDVQAAQFPTEKHSF